MTSDASLAGYRAAAAMLIPRFNAIDPATQLAPVIGHLTPPGRALDVGAGAGRDAAFLAGLGQRVTAAEPVEPFRRAGRLAHPAVDWRDARLPDLAGIRGPFDLLLVNAVMQHVGPRDREASLIRMAGLLAPGGRAVLSLRHGPGAPGRPAFPVDPRRFVATARRIGLVPRLVAAAAPVRSRDTAMSVRWTWVVLGSARRSSAGRYRRSAAGRPSA